MKATFEFIPVKLSKLEKFVMQNQNTSFDQLASMVNRTPGAMERAYDRAKRKMDKARAI